MAGPDAGAVFPDLKVVMDRLLALRGDDTEISAASRPVDGGHRSIGLGELHGV